MQTVTITLSDEMKQVAEERVAARGFGSLSEYLGALIIDDERRVAEEHLEDLVEEGLDTELTDFTEQDLEGIRSEALANLAARRSG